ncbi:hypothetical protein QBC35DRAFT_498703 [Podospora australis]|uniref:Uncharacterized protein n=1 Tax=Podospora australis TaxID=1536484 RepID=A0AAN6WS97_9PEZI|nr:hypothetical protein QBC35DRAFT_498703 [Podospora australis]
MDDRSDSPPPSSPCELFPACKEGDHGTYQSADGHHHAAKPIGKYYFTEDALKQDLHALRKGEVYERNEFYKRAKSWYKAEIDRLLHLEKIKEETEYQQPYSPTSPPTASTNRLFSSSPSVKSLRSGSPVLAKEPTRVQPSRAAKRKQQEDKPEEQQSQKRRPGAVSAYSIHSQGDYTLEAYDWSQFQTRNADEHTQSPWSHIQLQGLDVAYFTMRLERAVQAKVSSLISSGFLQRRSTFRCLLETPRYRKKARRTVFEPAASVSQGEGWRPPAFSSSPLSPPPVSSQVESSAVLDESEDEGEVWESLLETWAANEARKRRQSVMDTEKEMQRKRQEGTPAPEASMDISPTLGRWPGGGGAAVLGKRNRIPVENLERENAVEVSGLRFAVDLCASFQGREEFARFLML